MSTYAVYGIIVACCAIWGWLLSVVVQKVLFKASLLKEMVAGAVTDMSQFFISQPGEDVVNFDAIMQQLRPEIDSHVDHFIRVKMEENFPLIAKFMGEKTLARLKSAFMLEVESLLPLLLQKHGPLIISKINFATILSSKSGDRIVTLFNEKLAAENIRLKLTLAFICAGLVLGLGLSVVLHFIQ